jgi:hypothetical protein
MDDPPVAQSRHQSRLSLDFHGFLPYVQSVAWAVP